MKALCKQYQAYLMLERAYAKHTIAAYLSDLDKLLTYFAQHGINYATADLPDFRNFLLALTKLGIQHSSQARMVSSIKAFYAFLCIEEKLDFNPVERLETPKLARKLPQVLSVEEINLILEQIDLSKPEGQRNKAIIETLYSCGLRVSELVELKLSQVYWEEAFVAVQGKGEKQRLVPISETALKEIRHYLSDRNVLPIQAGEEDIVFLNRRGHRLTRQMIFMYLKSFAAQAGIEKKVSPHTLRHSFATHLMEGGASIRVIQEMLGHESILTTEIYAHMDMSYLRETILMCHPRNKEE